jgi:segregation and condensation protein A
MMLQHGRPVPFRDLFEPPHTRSRLIGVFLAILELFKLNEIVLDQPEPFGQIWVQAVTTGEPIA